VTLIHLVNISAEEFFFFVIEVCSFSLRSVYPKKNWEVINDVKYVQCCLQGFSCSVHNNLVFTQYWSLRPGIVEGRHETLLSYCSNCLSEVSTLNA
jgi:hypothetical protein